MEGQSNSGSPFSTSPKPHFLFQTMQNSSKLCIPHIYIGRWNLFWPFSTPPGARWTGASRKNWDYIVWKVSIGSWLWDWRISRKDSDWELLVLSVCTHQNFEPGPLVLRLFLLLLAWVVRVEVDHLVLRIEIWSFRPKKRGFFLFFHLAARTRLQLVPFHRVERTVFVIKMVAAL